MCSGFLYFYIQETNFPVHGQWLHENYLQLRVQHCAAADDDDDDDVGDDENGGDDDDDG